MGCFIACFGSSKDTKCRKHRRKRNSCSSHEKQRVSSVQDCSKTLLNTAPRVQAKPENIGTRKKVTFDSNVKTYEPVLLDEVGDFQLEKSEEGGGEEEALVNSRSCSEDSSVTSTGSYPTNHRYHNCQDSDVEDGEELDYYWDNDLTDEDEDGIDMEAEEYDELGEDFEDGLVCSGVRIDVNQIFVEEVENPVLTSCDRDVRSIGLNPNARDRSVYVHPVLNPVENLTQWKAVKAKKTPPLGSLKENYNIASQESRVALSAEQPSLKESSLNLKSDIDPSKKLNQEIQVDASLSNWLVSSKNTPPKRSSSQGSNSVISHEDRPILGALTVEELKQFSVSSSPRKSPCQSPDEMAIIGSVGTYWNFKGSAEDSSSATSFKGSSK